MYMLFLLVCLFLLLLNDDDDDDDDDDDFADCARDIILGRQEHLAQLTTTAALVSR